MHNRASSLAQVVGTFKLPALRVADKAVVTVSDRHYSTSEAAPHLCGHIFDKTGMTLNHRTGRAYYWRRCAICGFTEYRDQNTPVKDK